MQHSDINRRNVLNSKALCFEKTLVPCSRIAVAEEVWKKMKPFRAGIGLEYNIFELC
ncbi:MAG: hypothetical protein JNL57_05835 [Bacteroidetes bacterium]|nr:hypothetical protein [Bacteroidota bacterium]